MHQDKIFNEFFIAPNYRKKYLKLYSKTFSLYLPVSSKKQQPFLIKYLNGFLIIFLCVIFKILKRKIFISDPARMLQGLNFFNPFFFKLFFKNTLYGFWWNGFYEYELFSAYINKLPIPQYFNAHIKLINRQKYPKNINFFTFPEIKNTYEQPPLEKNYFEYDFSFVGQIIDHKDVEKFLSSEQIDELLSFIDMSCDYKQTDSIVFQDLFNILENKILIFLKQDHVNENIFRIISYFFRVFVVVNLLRKFPDKSIYIAGVDRDFLCKNFSNLSLAKTTIKDKISFDEMMHISNLSKVVLDLGSKCFPDPNYPRSAIMKANLKNNIRSFCYKNKDLTL